MKDSLVSADVFLHCDAQAPLKLVCDASTREIGAVISHVMADGEERPIASASRSLTKAKFSYSQIEKEGLAIVFGVKGFISFFTEAISA